MFWFKPNPFLSSPCFSHCGRQKTTYDTSVTVCFLFSIYPIRIDPSALKTLILCNGRTIKFISRKRPGNTCL